MQNLINRVREIKEKNLLIAEFDDYLFGPSDRASDLKYYESWDALMPVVARITRNTYYIESSAKEHVRHLIDVLPFAYIEDVHEAVYRFCKWWKAKKG
jgi:hypothetical protein